MAIKFLNNIDLGQNELISPRIHNLVTGSEPATGLSGQIYYNSTINLMKMWNGTAWVILGNLYSTSVVSSGGVKLRLTGSDSSTDDVLFSGTNIAVAATDASTITLSIPQSVATTANPVFAGATLGTIRVGITADNEIDTTTGDLILDSASGTTRVEDTLVVAGNLFVNGTTTTINTSTTTLDDPILTLGGDEPAVETTKDRGIEAKWNGTTITVTQYVATGTNVITASVASTTGYLAGDIIKISLASGTEQQKLNGVWTITSVPNATTFVFSVTLNIASGTYTTTIGTCVKSKNAFFGLDQSTGKFTFIPQANNISEVFSGSVGTIVASFEGNGSALTNLNASNLSSGTLAVARGGTNIASYTIGDLIYASATTTLSKLADVATGNVLLSGGVGAAPSYGKVGLTTHITGTLGVTNGGTGKNTAPTIGGVAYGASATAYNTTAAGTSGYLLKSNAAGAPTWTPNDLTSFPTSNFKKSVKVATTAAADITTGGIPSTTVTDGITVAVGDRVLVRGQVLAKDNGIYIVQTGAWTRSTAADGSTEIDSAIVGVEQGTLFGGHFFTNKFKSTDVVGTTDMPWYRVVYEGDTTIWNITANLASGITGTLPIASGGTGATTAAAARTNLGLKTFAANIGNGSLTTIPVTHNCGTRDVSVQVYRNASPYDTIFVDVERTDANTINLKFVSAPATNEYRVLINQIS